ncbi:MAG: TRAP transporter small permease [Methylobacteriaceae bacterium]|nr:TRAP transporter small permease [Methylobacteriaceae bacterium]
MSGAPVYRENADLPAGDSLLPRLARALAAINSAIMALAGLAAIAASLVLSYSVLVRYILHAPTYWQDEAAVFLLVGATFLTAAFVQERRGHVGIEAFAELLSPAANRIRLALVDIFSFAFCAFFAWKSWTLFHEAWVDGQVTSSPWAPPLWIPYFLMAAGMTLLSLQIALQIAIAFAGKRS